LGGQQFGDDRLRTPDILFKGAILRCGIHPDHNGEAGDYRHGDAQRDFPANRTGSPRPAR